MIGCKTIRLMCRRNLQVRVRELVAGASASLYDCSILLINAVPESAPRLPELFFLINVAPEIAPRLPEYQRTTISAYHLGVAKPCLSSGHRFIFQEKRSDFNRLRRPTVFTYGRTCEYFVY